MSAVALRKTMAVVLILTGTGAPAKGGQPRTHTDLYGDPLPPGAAMRLGSVRLRHAGSMIAFAADGKTVISIGNDQTIRHWDVATGRERRRIQLQNRGDAIIAGLRAWGGNTFVTAKGWAEETRELWDASTGEHRRSIRVGNTSAGDLVVSPDGSRLAAINTAKSGCLVRIWDTASGEESAGIKHPTNVSTMAFSADHKLLGTVWVNDALRLWDAATGKELHTIPGASQLIAFSPDGSKVASADRKGILKVWNVADGHELASFKETEDRNPFSLAFSPDNRTLAVATWDETLLFDVAARKLLRSIPAFGWLTFAPDGKTLASSIATAIHLWDPATGRELSPRPGHNGNVSFLTVAPDGRSLASISPIDSAIRIWDLTSGKSLAVLKGEWKRRNRIGSFYPDGKRFVSGGMDAPRLWDAATGRKLRRFPLELAGGAGGHSNPEPLAFAVPSDSPHLIAVSVAWHTRGGLRPIYQLDIWDREKGVSLQRRQLPTEDWPACFSPDARTLLFRAREGLIVQDVVSGREWARLTGGLHHPFAFSPDGQIVAATIYKTKKPAGDLPSAGELKPEDASAIVLVELASGKQLARFEPGPGGLNRLAFGPNGRTLATVEQDALRLWDIATGKELLRRGLPEKGRKGGYSFATSLAFLPGGDRLATGLMDGTTLIWDLELKTWRAGVVAKDLDGRDLERLWTDLAGEDAAKAHRAVWTLAAVPAKAVPFLKDHLHPVAPVDVKEVQRLIADLDSAQFATRAAAGKKLAALGEQTEPALRQALEGKPSLEVRKRLEALRADAERAGHGLVRSAEVLRTLRAMRALEAIGTSEARQVLHSLADGDPAARTTRYAQEALRRLPRRDAVIPEPSGAPRSQTQTPPPARP